MQRGAFEFICVGPALREAIVAMQYLTRVVLELDRPDLYPGLHAHRERCEALDAFIAVQDSRDKALASGWRPKPASG